MGGLKTEHWLIICVVAAAVLVTLLCSPRKSEGRITDSQMLAYHPSRPEGEPVEDTISKRMYMGNSGPLAGPARSEWIDKKYKECNERGGSPIGWGYISYFWGYQSAEAFFIARQPNVDYWEWVACWEWEETNELRLFTHEWLFSTVSFLPTVTSWGNLVLDPYALQDYVVGNFAFLTTFDVHEWSSNTLQ